MLNTLKGVWNTEEGQQVMALFEAHGKMAREFVTSQGLQPARVDVRNNNPASRFTK